MRSPVEVSYVRQQLKLALDRSRRDAQERRQRTTDAVRAFEPFLADVATPVFRMLAMAMKAEGLPFTVSTPGGSVRLSADNAREDVIEVLLDSSVDPPQVIGRVHRARGSRTLAEEVQLKPGAPADTIDEDDVLRFLLTVLGPWLER